MGSVLNFTPSHMGNNVAGHHRVLAFIHPKREIQLYAVVQKNLDFLWEKGDRFNFQTRGQNNFSQTAA